MVNLETPCKNYDKGASCKRDLDELDNYLVVHNSEIMCGLMDKTTVGEGKKSTIFYIILRDFGPD